MIFKSLERKLGFSLAMVLLWDSLKKDEEFIRGISFEQWHDIRQKIAYSNETKEIRQFALQQMRRLTGKSFKRQLKVVRSVNLGDPHRSADMKKMFQLAKTISQKRKAFIHSDLDISERWDAIDDMYKLAKSFRDYLLIYTTPYVDTEYTSPTLEKMSQFHQSSKTFKQWSRLFDDVVGLSDFTYLEYLIPVLQIILKAMSESAETFEEWLIVLKKSLSPGKPFIEKAFGKFQKTARQKMFDSAASLKQWRLFYECLTLGKNDYSEQSEYLQKALYNLKVGATKSS